MTDDEIAEFGSKCPICRNEWSFVPRIVCAGNWVHCTTCAKKAEVILKEERERKRSTYKNMRDELDAMSYNYGGVDWGHKK